MRFFRSLRAGGVVPPPRVSPFSKVKHSRLIPNGLSGMQNNQQLFCRGNGPSSLHPFLRRNGTACGRHPAAASARGLRERLFSLRCEEAEPFLQAPILSPARYKKSLEHFQFETLRVSNHTACRFAEKKRGFSAHFGPGGAVPPPRVSPFSKLKRSSSGSLLLLQ